MPTVKEIIEKYLKENGFDGLVGDECGCDFDCLMDCENDCSGCVPGKKIFCKDCPEAGQENCDHYGDLLSCKGPLRFCIKQVD